MSFIDNNYRHFDGQQHHFDTENSDKLVQQPTQTFRGRHG